MSYQCTRLDLANFLYNARVKAKVSQKELAHRAKTYACTISLIENAKILVSTERLVLILNGLDLELIDLHHHLKDKYVIQP